ncbi:helix-turn-helix domain-containing protein [Janibacter cremeus]|uniref:Helix-turn-helix domain-containing protein n=1 Tax=Janibacter cremeus TaxID=1285192 RepID=A0A852VX30_9MICO|nr:helix-turn-helix domain-containing protein [Janibacter cremeus]NYF99213.1 hypothetical protein [Janibacter cremeus]
MSEDSGQRHMTPKELAERWGCSTGHLANLRTEGRGLPFLKFPGRVLYRLADVLAYEDAHVVGPVSA